jgi:hypothetical protein
MLTNLGTGFVLLDERPLGRHGHAQLFEDVDTGLRHVHLAVPDPESLVAVMVATPSDGRPGLPHALEHLVGAGSARYPVPRLFASMPGRAHTDFINAVTGPDHTTYLASSTCSTSFDLLCEVLLDGVFAPLLTDSAFAEEVVSRRLDGARSGVVWQETLDRIAHPQSAARRALAAAVYRRDAVDLLQGEGSDPADIVRLTVDAARAYHRRHYRPMLAWLVTAGEVQPQRVQGIARAILARGTWDEFVRLPRFALSDPGSSPVTCQGVAYLPGRIADALVAVPFGPIGEPGTAAWAEVLSDALTGAGGPMPRALRAAGTTVGPVAGAGVDLRYPYVTLAVGAPLAPRVDPQRLHSTVVEALVEPLPADAVRRAARRRLLDQRDRAVRGRPPHSWGVRTVLDLAGSLVHGADALSFCATDRELLRLIDEPEMLSDWLRSRLAAEGTRLAVVSRVGRASPVGAAGGSPAVVEAPAPEEVGAGARRATVELPAVPVSSIAPLTPVPAVRSTGTSDVWEHRLATADVVYLTIDIDASAVPDNLLPLLGRYTRLLGRARPLAPEVSLTFEADPSCPWRAYGRLRVAVHGHADETDHTIAVLSQLLTEAGRAEALWRGSLSAAPTLDLLLSAVAAASGAAPAKQDLSTGWRAERAMERATAETAAEARAAISAAPRRLVVTGDRPAHVDLADWPVRPQPTPVETAAGSVVGSALWLSCATGPSAVVASFPGVGAADPDAAPLAIATAVLHERVLDAQRRRGTHGVRCSYHWRTGAISVRCVGTADPRATLSDLDECLADLIEDPPTAAEHTTATRGALSSLAPAFAVDRAAADHLWDRRTHLDAARAALRAALARATQTDVTAAASRYLAPRRGARGVLASPSVLTAIVRRHDAEPRWLDLSKPHSGKVSDAVQ